MTTTKTNGSLNQGKTLRTLQSWKAYQRQHHKHIQTLTFETLQALKDHYVWDPFLHDNLEVQQPSMHLHKVGQMLDPVAGVAGFAPPTLVSWFGVTRDLLVFFAVSTGNSFQDVLVECGTLDQLKKALKDPEKCYKDVWALVPKELR